MTNKEIRFQDFNNEDLNVISGYACVFEKQSENIGFIEVIKRGAITEDTISNSDVFALFNHDNSKVLARSKRGKGSLSLSLDDNGLKYEFEIPKTSIGNDIKEYVKRGDISQSSFAFTVAKGGDKWEKKNGVMYRTITKIDKLFDVSPVFSPAYSDTVCSYRFDDMQKVSNEIDNKMNSLIEDINSL